MPGLSVHELRLEVFPVAICRLFFDDNLLVVVRQLIDDIFDGAFSKFELVEGGDALGRDGDPVGQSFKRFRVPWRNRVAKYRRGGGTMVGSGLLALIYSIGTLGIVHQVCDKVKRLEIVLTIIATLREEVQWSD